MSLDATRAFIGFIGVGCGIPALLLVAGFPDPVCTGLGRPHTLWKRSAEATFGLYMYTVSDICLGALCGASLMGITSPALALGATAVHQFSYVAAAISAFGIRKDYLPSVIVGSIAGWMSLRNKRS